MRGAKLGGEDNPPPPSPSEPHPAFYMPYDRILDFGSLPSYWYVATSIVPSYNVTYII